MNDKLSSFMFDDEPNAQAPEQNANIENQPTYNEGTEQPVAEQPAVEQPVQQQPVQNTADQFAAAVSGQADEPTVIKTDEGQINGQKKCPKCGATDISLNINNGKLRCNFCRHEFEPEIAEEEKVDLSTLSGEYVGSGATDIQADAEDMITLKCSSCGAEVVIDTNTSTQARCHWCRNTLSLNAQVPNGAVPDQVLPFKLTREQARGHIEKFVGARKFFAHPKFKKEFTTENVMGVYFPYMVVDANTHADFVGQGEHETRRYTLKDSDGNKTTYYDADLYNVSRSFDMTINGLTVESSLDKLDSGNKQKTTNIINSIMPFDTENCVKWDSNYLKGYTSEKRDVNVDSLKGLVAAQTDDIARHAANETLKHYDRGVRWDTEKVETKGQRWKSAYLPVWLYSYQQKKGKDSLLHYVAVNARTQETMGSVPIHMPKLLFVSAIIEILGLIAAIFTNAFFYSNSDEREFWPWLFLTAGFAFYFYMYSRYRNQGARHYHEKETKTEVTNMQKTDDFVEKRKGLTNATMHGANNTRVGGTTQNVLGSSFKKAAGKAKGKG
ncbi:MAG: TFIIB-type zinc ribbon-containing protein [Clostridia bacterium]|nr:TFIIB-type zinc ribbon-containing protein [Clostridia bacterium]